MEQPTQRTSYVQAVDFSTMLYGLAALPEYLGPSFFTKYNDFNFYPTTSVNDLELNNKHLDNYPNPFSNHTNIAFEITAKSKVVLEVYTLNGQRVKQLVNTELSAGKHSIPWNARNENNSKIEPGVYVCRMLVGNQSEISKQMLVVN